ncbi:MAG: UbiA prenyltransferase family protein [Clostridiales Family XIII bacterium]|nr:UbiA prenyltransferase family protein [Clostridiales Family XIII bacterium]
MEISQSQRVHSCGASDYLHLARFDHWIKQLFILPGMGFAIVLVDSLDARGIVVRFALGFVATCLIASANYIINEWLDAEFDQYHPTKKFRPAVAVDIKAKYVYGMYALFGLSGMIAAFLASWLVFWSALLLFVMGIVYNVRPLRSKEVPYVDVLSESINNAIRLLIGWFIVTSDYFPPATIVFGFWMGGAFLMATKRYAEYRMIGDKQTAALYRKSFAKYSEKSLLVSAFFYALCALFFTGVFMVKYRVELLISIPVLCGLFCYYLHIAYKKDSAAQKPEKLFREKGLTAFVVAFVATIAIAMFVDIPALNALLETSLIGA